MRTNRYEQELDSYYSSLSIHFGLSSASLLPKTQTLINSSICYGRGSSILPLLHRDCVSSGFRREVGETYLVCAITQEAVVIPYGRFGTTSGPSSETLEAESDRMSRTVRTELPLRAA